jgi:predicted TIM-barrel fold metal-dependent hydrolase
VFAGIDYAALSQEADIGQVEADRLRESVAAGARGLKIWKTLGLHAKDSTHRRIPVDDDRLDPLWAAAAELGVPVLIHVADPMAFFQPLDLRNERYAELRRHPDWYYHSAHRADGRVFPTHTELMAQFQRLLERHPQTTFIGAHLASSGEDLAALSAMLDRHANLTVDIAARINELGRQPYSARDFLERYQDRVLFGTDAGPNPRAYRLYYRFLETRAEYMSYSLWESHRQGEWRIYGVDLPDAVLRKVYRDNAKRLIRFGA